MKRYIIYIAVMLCAGLHTVEAQRTKTLYIYHTNDMHSRIDPYPTTFGDTLFAGKGGLVRRASFLEIERAKHKDLLLFDSGDFSQGTPYYNLFKGEVEIRAMNEMNYDACTIGNHEFDFGLENMARLFRMAKFPIVCANYDVRGTVLEGLVKPYVVLRRNGLRIGVFGVGTVLEGLVARENYGDVKFQDPVRRAQEVSTHLKLKEKCDVIICLSHLGWMLGDYNDVNLIQNTRYIDVVLGGHSHSFFETIKYYDNADGKPVGVQQMGKSSVYVGKITLELKKK
ncbi:bifunctional metallophosphatase/5'-nucleotidase [Bacteroides heparinolyticus]|uniref:bifunctional metallophosphatase/5'-nucleotidase n=1 Tax=Prevotella heparinolytica TaxID=28113 RepID=UPI00359F96F8